MYHLWFRARSYGFDVRLGYVVVAEQFPVQLGVLVADRLVGEEAQRLVVRMPQATSSSTYGSRSWAPQ